MGTELLPPGWPNARALEPNRRRTGPAVEKTLTVTGVTFLLAAFLWDVAFCGEVVNGDGKLIRRPGRALLYLAFLLATSAVTLYFASAPYFGTLNMDTTFAPETQVALGVVLVGIAWTVVAFFGGVEVERVQESVPPPAAGEPASSPAVISANASGTRPTALTSAGSDTRP